MQQQIDGFHIITCICDTGIKLLVRLKFIMSVYAVYLGHMIVDNITNGAHDAAFAVITGHMIIGGDISAFAHIISIIVAYLIAVVIIYHPALFAAHNYHTVCKRLNIRIIQIEIRILLGIDIVHFDKAAALFHPVQRGFQRLILVLVVYQDKYLHSAVKI